MPYGHHAGIDGLRSSSGEWDSLTPGLAAGPVSRFALEELPRTTEYD
jgi:hypothetical protein